MTNWIKNLRTFVASLNWNWLVRDQLETNVAPAPQETAATFLQMSGRIVRQPVAPETPSQQKYQLALERQRAKLTAAGFVPLTQPPSLLGPVNIHSLKAATAARTVVSMEEWLALKLSDGSIK